MIFSVILKNETNSFSLQIVENNIECACTSAKSLLFMMKDTWQTVEVKLFHESIKTKEKIIITKQDIGIFEEVTQKSL